VIHNFLIAHSRSAGKVVVSLGPLGILGACQVKRLSHSHMTHPASQLRAANGWWLAVMQMQADAGPSTDNTEAAHFEDAYMTYHTIHDSGA
jgi:hypothetical protein